MALTNGNTSVTEGLLISKQDKQPYVFVQTSDLKVLASITLSAEQRYFDMGYRGFDRDFDSMAHRWSTGFFLYDQSSERVMSFCRFVRRLPENKIPIEHGTMLPKTDENNKFSVELCDVDPSQTRTGELNTLITLRGQRAVPPLLVGIYKFLAEHVDVAFSTYDVAESQSGYRLGQFFESIGCKPTPYKMFFPGYTRNEAPCNWQIIRIDRPEIESQYCKMLKGEGPYKHFQILGKPSQEDLEGIISKIHAGLPWPMH